MSYSWSVSSNQAMRDARLSYAKHIGNFVSNPNSIAIRARSQAIMHCEMHVSHTPNTLATLFEIQIQYLAIRARSQSIMHCEMQYARTPNTLATLFKSKFSSYACSISSNQVLRDALLAYTKHISNSV